MGESLGSTNIPGTHPPLGPATPAPAVPPGLNIRYATPGYAVIDKPAGLLSVPGKGEHNRDCVPARVRMALPGATGPIVVHRLDMDTSGLLVVALNAAAQRDLSSQFESRRVAKSYTALVDGEVAAEHGTISVPVRPDLLNRPYQVVDLEHHRAAVTSWRVLAYETDRTRLDLVPLTGRTHQLRVHCAYPGPGGLRGTGNGSARAHPILGDVLYGPPWIDPDAWPRLMLHAAFLAFTDPDSGRLVEFRSPAPF